MKKIAICGFNLEANRFAQPCARADFEENMYFRGAEIDDQARAEHPRIHLGVCGFYEVMDEAFGGPENWTPAPALLVGTTPAGPVEEAFFEEFLDELREALRAHGAVDGVYVCQHGAAVATHTHDPDGEIFRVVRETVGPGIPVIATLDLHANPSSAMMEAADLLIGYRTNPHVDLRERGAEAARAMLEMFDGVRPVSFRVRLPLVAPSVTQLTAEGHPFGDLIRRGQEKIGPDIMNVTMLSGFAFADTPRNGLTVIAAARSDAGKARTCALELASAAWADRERYRPRMIPVEEAARLAAAAGRDSAALPLLFADPGDNPGGGGRGNTTWILRAFLEAGVEGGAFAVFWDRAVAAAASAATEGDRLDLVLNSEEESPFSESLSVSAKVLRLFDGKFIARHGMAAGKTVDLGPTAVLEIEGIRLVTISKRQQCLSTDYLEAFGIDPAECRWIVVKSRGHFRAGFAHMFPPERIHEVDAPGLTSPNLAGFDWRYLPRPVFPLDEDAVWDPDSVPDDPPDQPPDAPA